MMYQPPPSSLSPSSAMAMGSGKAKDNSNSFPTGKPPLPPSAFKNTSSEKAKFLGKEFGSPGRSSSYPNIRLNPTISEFDMKMYKLRLDLRQSREDLSGFRPNLEEMERAVRSSLAIDRAGLTAVGPLPTLIPVRTTSRGTNTELSFIPFYCHSSSPLTQDPLWKTFLVPSPSSRQSGEQVGEGRGSRAREQEWTELVTRAALFYSPSSLPSASNGSLSVSEGPLSFSKVLETDLDTTVLTDSTGREPYSTYTSEVNVDTVDYSTHDDEAAEQYDEYYDHDGVEKKDSAWNSYPNHYSPGKNVTGFYFESPVFAADRARPTLSSPPIVQKTRSMLNLGTPVTTAQKASTLSPYGDGAGASARSIDERARSMEFLLNDSNKNAHLLPPENTLMQQSQENRQLSQHEIRIQRSLDKHLNVPDWYKKYGNAGEAGAGPKSPGGQSGGKKPFGSGTGLAGGWAGLSSSKTSSLTSLQSAGRYTGRTPPSSTRQRNTGTTSTGGRSSRESLMSPSSTASASPSPYYERSSFTYGMPYALTRFASARMSCGASPSSLSPSPSPVGGLGSSTSTPTASGPSSRHHHGFNKTPYLGWRSQERLASKSLYKSPQERLAADLLETHHQRPTKVTVSVTDSEKSSINIEISPKKETPTTASDLSLNNSEGSTNSHKLSRVRSSIKEQCNAIVSYVNESKPMDEGINGGASPRRGLVWLESSFVGTKPLDSPENPAAVVIPASRKSLPSPGSGSRDFAYGHSQPVKKTPQFREDPSQARNHDIVAGHNNTGSSPPGPPPAAPTTTTTTTTPYYSRNEQMEERLSNSSAVSSPTLDDILDSLLALRRPNKTKVKSRAGTTTSSTTLMKGHFASSSASPPCRPTEGPPPPPPPTTTSVISKIESSFLHNPNAPVGLQFSPAHKVTSPISDWQLRMNQPLLDSAAYFPDTDDFFVPRVISTPEQQFLSNNNSVSLGEGYNISPEANVREVEPHGYRQDGPEETQALLGEDEVDTFIIPTGTEAYSYRGICTVPNPAVASAMNESSTPSSPRHTRRVSFDLDIEDKEEKSSSRSRKEDIGGLGTIHCRNSKCGKTATGLEARREFKTCHNCNAYYCTRECRRAHWEKHKKVCMQSRVGALCKQIISHVKDDSNIVTHLSTIAKRGLLSKGRGCVKLFFSSPDRAERFLTGGFPDLPEPWYIRQGEVLPEEMGAQVFSELNDQIGTYNMENRFVLYVSLCVVNEVPTSGAVKWEREMISRSAKLRLLLPRSFDEQAHHQAANPAHMLPEDVSSSVCSTPPQEPEVNFYDPAPPFPADEFLPPAPGEGETLILRSVPSPSMRRLSSSEHRRMREVTFANIQKHLNSRGVELRRTYPDIYSRLCNYVENDEPFLPVTIYPRNTNTGNQFVCIIMPESSDSDNQSPPFDPTRHVETINISGLNFDD